MRRGEKHLCDGGDALWRDCRACHMIFKLESRVTQLEEALAAIQKEATAAECDAIEGGVAQLRGGLARISRMAAGA